MLLHGFKLRSFRDDDDDESTCSLKSVVFVIGEVTLCRVSCVNKKYVHMVTGHHVLIYQKLAVPVFRSCKQDWWLQSKCSIYNINGFYIQIGWSVHV